MGSIPIGCILGDSMGRKGSSLVGRMLKAGGEKRKKATKILVNLAIEKEAHRPTMAAELGVSEVTLWRWCQTYGIDLDTAALDWMGSAEGASDGG